MRPSVSKAWTVGIAETLLFGVEQASEGAADAIGLKRLLQAWSIAARRRDR